MQRVDELTEPPVVGEFYLVPTARELWQSRMSTWPVLLPFHEDKEIIGYEWDHVHLDRRFLTPRQWQFASAESYYLNTKRIIDGRPLSQYVTDAEQGIRKARPRPPIEWRRRKCYRKMTPHVVREVKGPHWLDALESAYANCHLKPGLVCPHRGAHLGSLPVDTDGNVVCPMHGLKWNVATGALVRGGDRA